MDSSSISKLATDVCKSIPFKTTVVLNNHNEFEVKKRRSANYHPTVWETKRIESFFTPYSYQLYDGRLGELKRMARSSLKTTKDPRALLSLVDSMQRLGVSYHFEDEIEEAVSLVHNQNERNSIDDDLYTTALKFRILREHGREISSSVFDRFKGQDGRFLKGLSSDVRGFLSLYEATHLGTPEEDGVMLEAKVFTVGHLKCSSSCIEGNYLDKQVHQSLEVPLHWMMPRIKARNSIDLYQLDGAICLELAKLDYNLVQSVYQDELKILASWWRDLGLKEAVPFARDRLMENYLWIMGIVFEPRLSKCRIGATKFVCLLTVIDDIYDVYGLLDELESFTKAVERWDIEATVDLPLCMKVCYIAMLSCGNEIIHDVRKNHGLDVSSYIKGEWLNLCRSYLIEARWFNSGYRPTLEEYLANASISVGGHAGIVHACILQLGLSIPKASLESCFDHGSKLIHLSSLITRLSDDLGTSKDESERGDVAKSVECYMLEKGTSEEEARTHIREMISQTWNMMNREVMVTMTNDKNVIGLPKSLVKMCLNMARTAQCIFQHGDGIGMSTGITRDRLSSLIVKPIPIE